MRSNWRRLVVSTLTMVGVFLGLGPDAQSAPKQRGTTSTYVAYFYTPDRTGTTPLGAYLVPVVFPLPETATGTERLRLAFQALCEKPPWGLTGAIKPGCKVGSAKIEGDGTLVVDYAEGEVFEPAGTTGESMMLEQIAMTAAQFVSVHRVTVAFHGRVPRDLGSHGMGNHFQAPGRSRMCLVTPPVRRGERPETESLRPGSAAVRNATTALARPLLGVINRRLSELGHTDHLARAVDHIIPSGDGTIWVKVSAVEGIYRLWWTGTEWQVGGM